MKKKMLLTAVGDYQNYAPTLNAPTQELDRWEALLTAAPYGLQPVIPSLKDSRATKKNILAGLEQLLSEATSDEDQLLFLFCGHGTRIGNQQGIIAYPDGDSNLRNATITIKDVHALLQKYPAAKSCDFTIVLDSCFARGFLDPERVPLFVPLDEDDLFDRDDTVRRVLQFTDLAGPRVLDENEPSGLVVMTASAENQAAYEIRDGRMPRLLFSLRAITQLTRQHDTHAQLIKNITPLRAGFPQQANVDGHPQRLGEKFPGQPDSRLRVSRALRLSQEAPLHMRVMGLGCFIEPRSGADGFKNRIVFPYDTVGTGEMKHFAFIEVPEAALVGATGDLEYRHYFRAGSYYRRWSLNGHRVLMDNAYTDEGFSRSAAFETHVPSLRYTSPELKTKSPRDECYEPYPQPSLITGFVDLFNGYADVGELEHSRTFFTRQTGDIPTEWGPEYTPISVVVTQKFTGPHAIILVSTLDGSATAQLFLKPGSTILVGNAREADLTGPPMPDNFREHFLIYYNLAKPGEGPTNPGLPAVEVSPLNACSPVKWP